MLPQNTPKEFDLVSEEPSRRHHLYAWAFCVMFHYQNINSPTDVLPVPDECPTPPSAPKQCREFPPKLILIGECGYRESLSDSRLLENVKGSEGRTIKI